MTATPATFGGGRRSSVREFADSVRTIMVKELRSRMRGRRAFILLTIYLGLLALIAYAVYLVAAPNVAGGGGFGQPNASALIGQSIFLILSIFQLILICFIAPAATAGQISLEREKQTLDLLISTPMRPGAIVIGKLAAALAYVVLMILAAIPITAIVLMYGGATIGDIVRQQLVLLATAVALGAVGLFYSALLKRTQAATVLTYITVLVLTLGTAAVFVFWTLFANQTDDGFAVGPRQRAPEQLLYFNPGVAMLDVISATEADPFGGITRTLAELRGESIEFGGIDCIGPDCGPVDDVGNAINIDPGGGAGYWWTRISVTFLALAAVLTVASMRLVVPAGMRGIRRRPSRAAATSESTTDEAPSIEELRGDET